MVSWGLHGVVLNTDGCEDEPSLVQDDLELVGWFENLQGRIQHPDDLHLQDRTSSVTPRFQAFHRDPNHPRRTHDSVP